MITHFFPFPYNQNFSDEHLFSHRRLSAAVTSSYHPPMNALARALLVGICVSALACGGGSSEPDGGTGDAQPNGDAAVIPDGPPTPGDIPTIAGLDFAAFPTAPARPYQPTGATIHVATTGDDANPGTAAAPVQTVNRGVALAQSGDLVLVHAGTYGLGDGSDYVGLRLETANVILAADGSVTLQPGADGVGYGIVASADDLTIDGFRLEGFSGQVLTFGRTDSPQRRLVIRGVVTIGGTDGFRSADPGSGPVIEGLLVIDSRIVDASMVGFNCGEGPCNDLRLERLSVSISGDFGSSGADAVAVESGDNILVYGSLVEQAPADGFDFKATRVAVVNTVVHDVGQQGVKLWHGGDLVNSLIYNTHRDAAVVFDGGGRYRVLNTTVAYHERGGSAYAMTVGYDLPDEQIRLEIVNSIFYENSGCIWLSPGTTQLDVRNSIFYGSGDSSEITWARSAGEIVVGEGYDPLSALEGAGGGSGNLGFVDPRFVQPDAGDFHLQSTSPGRDHGVSWPEAFPTFDLTGGPRIVGSAPDLGPYEQ
jgi:hypothetical protein